MGPALCIQTTRSAITLRPELFAGRKDAIPSLFLELTEASISQESPRGQVSGAERLQNKADFISCGRNCSLDEMSQNGSEFFVLFLGFRCSKRGVI